MVSGDYIAELTEVIRHLYNVEPVYVETVPVKGMFQDQIVWEGEVEVFRHTRIARSRSRLRLDA